MVLLREALFKKDHPLSDSLQAAAQPQSQASSVTGTAQAPAGSPQAGSQTAAKVPDLIGQLRELSLAMKRGGQNLVRN